MASIELNDKRTMWIMRGINHGVVNVNGHIKSLGLSPQSFEKQVKRIALKNPELYNQYIEQKELNLEIFKESKKKILLIVEDMIDNGILLEDGTIREFDLLDWHYIYNRHFQNLTRIFMTKLLNEIDQTEGKKRVIKTRQLLSRSYNDNLGCVSKKINSYYIMNDNTYGLTELEKTAIINYFYRNGIPYNYDTYYYAVKRIIDNREKCNNIDYNVIYESNNFDFVKNDVAIFNQLNEINKCFEFKLKKRTR